MTDPFERLMSDLTLAMGQLDRAGPYDGERLMRLQGQADRLNKIILASIDAKLEE